MHELEVCTNPVRPGILRPTDVGYPDEIIQGGHPMTNWHKLKRHLTTALDNPPPHTDKATIAQVLFLMATMETDSLPVANFATEVDNLVHSVAQRHMELEDVFSELFVGLDSLYKKHDLSV